MRSNVKPMDPADCEEKEKKSLSSNIMMKIVVFISNALGLWPFDQNKYEFRLFSKVSLVSLVKIAILTIPVLVFPITTYCTGSFQVEFDKKRNSTTFNTDEYLSLIHISEPTRPY